MSTPICATEPVIHVGQEAIPHLTRLIDAMRAGDDAHFNLEAIEWAEFLWQCIEDGTTPPDDTTPDGPVCKHCDTPIEMVYYEDGGTFWEHSEECPEDSACYDGMQGAEPS